MLETDVEVWILAIMSMIIMFLPIWYFTERRLQREREEQAILYKLLEEVPRYDELEKGFVVRIPLKSPFNIVIHRSTCGQARNQGESNMSSTWLGYYRNYTDAREVCDIFMSFPRSKIKSFYDCAICHPNY